MLGGVLAGSALAVSQKLPEPIALARSVPADARLFLEVADVHAFLQARAGQEFAELLAELMPAPATRPATQPAVNWQESLGQKLGLHDGEAARLLFGGRAALVSDSWNNIDDLVLLTEVVDAVAMEKVLEKRYGLIPSGEGQGGVSVRRYRLEDGHELACDGQVAVIGQTARHAGLYERTVNLWATGRRATLADLVDFRERTSGLPANANIVFYSGPAVRGPAAASALSIFWPDVNSVAVGVVMNGRVVTLETCASMQTESAVSGAEPPVDALLRLPANTVAAWTRPIRYRDEFKQLDAANPDGPVRFYLTVLQTGLPAGTLEGGLLQHLVGDSVISIGQQTIKPLLGDEAETLVLPTLALTVETDDPDAVAGVVDRMGENLLGLLNLQPPGGEPLTIQKTPLGSDGTVVRSLAVGRYFGATQPLGEFLGSVELSWTVADRWLIVATNPDTVRQMVAARRGETEPATVTGARRTLALVGDRKGSVQMALIARPDATAAMIDSWMTFIKNHHPEMLQAQYWERLRRQHLANNVQLGAVPRLTNGTEITVDRTMPGWPAHGVLQAGDRILSVDGQAINAANPLVSLRELVAARRKPDQVTLQIVRAGQPAEVTITKLPVPLEAQQIQPLALLGNIADLMRVFSSASYVTWQPSGERVNARLELELAPGVPGAGVAKVMVIAPTTAPAAPATQPAQTQPAPIEPVETQPAQTQPVLTQPAQ